MKKILLLLSILFFIPLIFAGTDLGAGYTYCYQETATSSSDCGTVSSGSYTLLQNYCSGGASSCLQAYDGNTATYGMGTATALTYNESNPSLSFITNYTKPLNYNNNSYFRTLFSNDPLNNTNVSMNSFSNCQAQNPLSFKSISWRQYSGFYYGGSAFYCYNGTDYEKIFNLSSAVNSNPAIIYEESMFWNISNLVENSQTFNSNTYGQSLESYSINLTYNAEDYPVITAVLNYNNTEYTTTKTGSGSNAIFISSVQLPTVSSQVNNTFYWTISITNSTDTYDYNSTINYQLVNPVSLGICNSTLNITALNLTAYSELSLERLYNLSFMGVINYWIGSSTDYKIFEFSNLSTSELDLCISNHVNYTTIINLQVSKTDYNPTEYNLINYELNNVTQHLNLYLLNVSSTTPFIIKVQGQNQLPLQDYYVYIYRYEPSSITPNLVQAVKTDSLGQTIGLFETYTTDYKFLIYDDDGNLVYTSEKMKIIPTTTPYTLTFTVGSLLPSPTTYYDNLTGVTWTLGYNKNTYLASLTYSDSNSSFVYGNLLVKALNMSGNDDIICNLTSSNPSAILVCDLTGNLSGGYVAEFYVNRNNNIEYVDSLTFNIETISQIVGMLGVLGAFFIILFASFVFFTNEIAGILSVNLAVFVCQVIGLINIGIIGMSAIIGISILIIIVLVRNQ